MKEKTFKYKHNPLKLNVIADDKIYKINDDLLMNSITYSRSVHIGEKFVLKLDTNHTNGQQCLYEYKFYNYIKRYKPEYLDRLVPIFAFGEAKDGFWLIQPKIKLCDNHNRYYFAAKIAKEIGILDGCQFGIYKRKVCFYDYGYNVKYSEF